MARSKAEENETPRGKFIRIAGPRATNALVALQRLENVWGYGGHKPEDVQRVRDALKDAMSRLEAAMSGTSTKVEKTGFFS